MEQGSIAGWGVQGGGFACGRIVKRVCLYVVRQCCPAADYVRTHIQMVRDLQSLPYSYRSGLKAE